MNNFFQTATFQNETNSFSESICIDDDTANFCQETIFFSTFANALQAEDLFGNIHDAPPEFRTVSGDLQRCLKLTNNQKEYEYTLLIFEHRQRMAVETFKHYIILNDPNEDKELKRALKSIHRDIDEKYKDNEDSVVSPSSLMSRIETVKKSKYNFKNYMSLMNGRPIHKDVDDMLNSILNKSEE